MREAKRPRTIAPPSSDPLLLLPATPSSDPTPPQSSQTLADLRLRLQTVGSLERSVDSQPSTATWQPVSSGMAATGGHSGSGTWPSSAIASDGQTASAAGEVLLDLDSQPRGEQTNAAEPFSSSPSSRSVWAQPLHLQPLPGSPFADALSTSQVVATQMPQPSPTQKRSKEEIQRKKEAALARRKQVEDNKKATERQAKRKQLAEMHLANFGFTIKPGISRYGSGTGGTVVKEEVSLVPEEWKPDDRCSDEQKACLQFVKEGKNIFFTGSAGVGKSFLLKEITRLLDHLKKPYQVTATTGIAALQVSGITIHSWAAVGLGKEPIPILYDKICQKKERKKAWLETDVLIIDEVSMSPADLFTKLNILGKMIRNNNKPFGGIQLIVSGDFFQLPPVPDKKSEEKCMRCGHQNLLKMDIYDSRLPYEERPAGAPQADIWRCTDIKKRNGDIVGGCGFEWRSRRFCFETEAWAECDFRVMELTKVFRQDHPEFIATLEKFRRGICDDAAVEFLKTCGTELGQGGNIQIQPTNLYPLRSNVDAENDREFKKLKEPAFAFQALDDSRGAYARTQMKDRLANVPPVQTLHLKKGAQVLLLANLDVKNGLVNGSRGVIVDWVDRNDVPIDAEEDERMPGMSQKLSVKGGAFGGEEWRAKAADEWADKQGEAFYPLVYFATGRQLIIKPHSWCIDLDRENTVARTQLPLQLAWALTIHKSQGQSLDAVGVRLTATFEKGQAYVALSRCRKPEGMKIEGFKPGVVMAHPTVKTFYDCIAAKTPFFVTSVPPVNPLSYIPEFDPLIHRLARTFGHLPAPLPVGSAVLAPGQKAPPPRLPPPAPAARAAPAPRIARQAPAAGPAPAHWQALLAQAAAAYTSSVQPGANDGIVDDSGTFVVEAKRAVLAASTGSAIGAVVDLGVMEIDDASKYETAESVVSSSAGGGSIGQGGQQQEGKSKKPKKTRWRKRVGH
ncbi:hypothetical protein JCM11641_004956 [Rhodosporidiobolus odoratus]